MIGWHITIVAGFFIHSDLADSVLIALAQKRETGRDRSRVPPVTIIFHFAPRVFLVCSLDLSVGATMTDNQTEEAIRKPEIGFAGLSEIDQAIRENRLMEYRIKKSWADPWGRKLTIIGIFVILAVFAFLAGASFGLW